MSDCSKPQRVREPLSQQECADDSDDIVRLKKELKKSNRKLEALLGIAGLKDAETKEISDHVLASIVSLTDSSYGFYGFLNEDESVMTIYSWSGNAMNDCSMVDKPVEYQIAEAGVWAEAIRSREPQILNDYSLEHPKKKGLPKGHVPLSKLLVIPFFRGDKIDAVAAVANREQDYTARDVDELSAFFKNIQMITDSQRAREALRRSEERYRLINDASQDFVYCYDLDSRFTFGNRYLCEQLRMSPEELTGKTHAELGFPQQHCQEWDALHKQVLDTDGAVTVFTSFPMPDGALHHYEVVLGPLHGKMGEIVGICGASRDLTELQRIREEKDELEEKYFQAQKMESVGRLAGGIAHNLNNMLSPILGYADMIADDLKKGTVQPHMVEKIAGSARRARDVVHQLLVFSRKQVMETKPVAFDDAIAGFEPLLRSVLREDIAIELDLNADSVDVLGDRGQIEQVIMNLAVNAQDAMPKGGTLTLMTSLQELGTDRDTFFEAPRPGRFVVLTVEDTGHGMEPRVREKVFEPFFTTKEVGKGPGLGLPMVWGIVKQHGGHIGVRSEADRGSAFKIALPVFAGKSDRRSAPIAEIFPRPRCGLETILVVEDEELVCNLTEDMLTHQGYTVLTAGKADQALAILEDGEVQIDLLLTDVVMPGLTGRELYHRAREMRPGLKVLFMSGYSDEVIAERGVLHEGVVLLRKPFSQTSLIQKVNEVLHRKE